jgi:mRNA interferase RelE/StbE
LANRHYEIDFAASAAKAFIKLDRPTQLRLARHIDLLSQQPRPHGARKLQGELDLYRIRVGDYRIIYSLHDRRLIVLVVAIGHRREVYKR